ncbi:hypothetical protein M2272_003135 [Mycobacterium frederiksbergense]|uniref:Uncharacterized protein n=1 Tax=Mycolicibacterium frederiksbergense TaxID=117567 RepID=A0ABT6L0L1_9MYCO|nr:hypothetical protein [Mycolicibacterium frederiksbergense]MDH6196492.1 hypothetical protein [Mycolicibacterium frederiksbergense]
MTETPASSEPETTPVATPAPAAPAPAAPAAPPAQHKPSRLIQAVAWVGIAAGIVFIVAVVFGTGFFLGAHSDGGHHRGGGGHDRGGMMMFHRDGPQMEPGRGMMPPFGPGGFGPGGFGPSGPGSVSERPEIPMTPATPARP